MGTLAFLAALFAFTAAALLVMGLHRVTFARSTAIRMRVQGMADFLTPGRESLIVPESLIRQDIASIPIVGRLLTNSTWASAAVLDLEGAGSQLRLAEYLMIRVLCAVIAFALALRLFGLGGAGVFLAPVAGLAGFMLPMLYIQVRKRRRLARLDSQLDETLTLISSSLKAGYGLLQSLEIAAQQMKPPISTELFQVVDDTRVGSSIEDALNVMNKRVGSYDLDIVVTAILVQLLVGGNLAEILDNVSFTIRERARIKGEINTLTTQKKLSGYVIALLPVVLFGLFFAMDPEYMKPMFTTPAGKILLGVGVTMDIIGMLVIRRILSIEI